ncbi:MAG: hypothetical protein IJS32_06720 [Kiritimatiellae bacterium]|nr:hypothetical protein [Kiritimatiellia bacterium]
MKKSSSKFHSCSAAALAALLCACGREETVPAFPDAPAPGEKGAAVAARFSPEEIRVGETAWLETTVVRDAGARVVFPPPPAGLERAEGRETPPAEVVPREDGKVEERTRVPYTSFEVTNFVWEGTATVERADGSKEETGWPFLALSVVTSLADGESELRAADLTLAKRPRGKIPWKAVLAGAIAALLAAGGAAWFLLRRKKLDNGPPPPPPEPAHVIALRGLDALEKEGYPARGEAERFYVVLSGIWRKYLKGRFGLSAPEKTTNELLRLKAFRETLSLANRQKIEAFLEEADKVKFARGESDAASMDRAFAAAKDFVLETAPRPEAAEGGGAKKVGSGPAAPGGAA